MSHREVKLAISMKILISIFGAGVVVGLVLNNPLLFIIGMLAGIAALVGCWMEKPRG